MAGKAGSHQALDRLPSTVLIGYFVGTRKVCLSGYNPKNPANRLRARRNLEAMMKEIMAEPPKGDRFSEGEKSPLFESMAPHLKMERLDGLHIYPGPAGGWHADISFRDLPAGIPNVIGTPKALPCRTRDEAVEAAHAMLSMFIGMMLETEGKPSTAKSDNATFIYDGITLRIPIGMLEAIKEAAGEPMPDYVRQRLSEVREEFGGGPGILDFAAVSALDRPRLLNLHAIAAMALLAGIHRWPETVDVGPPAKTQH